MVIVVAAHRQMQIEAGGFAQRTKHMRHQFGGEIADFFARERAVEYEIRATRPVQRRGRLRFVHRQGETVALHAALVAQRLPQRLSQRQRAVFDGVVFVDMQIAFAAQAQRKAAVLAQLFQHMVVEA